MGIAATNKVTLNSSITLNNGTGLTLNTGLVAIGSNNLTFATGSYSANSSVNSFVIADAASGNSGQVMKQFTSGTPAGYTYPIGSGAGAVYNYSPVSLTYSANSIQRTVGVNVTATQQPNDLTTSNYLSRYWTFTDNQAGTYTYTMTLQYSTSPTNDLHGTQNIMNINSWNGSAWTEYLTTYPANQFTMTGFNQYNAQIGGSQFTARINSAQLYTWNATSGGDWTVATNWTPTRFSPSNTDELRFNDGNTYTVINVPNQTVGEIIITNNGTTGTNVSLQSSGSSTLTLGDVSGPSNLLTIDGTSGMASTLQLSSTGLNQISLGFTNLTSPVAVTHIAGNIIINANNSTNNTLNLTASNFITSNNIITGTITNNGGVVDAGNFAMGVNSVYNHARDGGAIPYFSTYWNPTSLCNITGVIATSPTGFNNQTYGQFTYNCPGQTAAVIDMSIQNYATFAGNFTLVSTGSPSSNSLLLCDWGQPTVTFGTSANAPADLIIQGGTLNLDNTPYWSSSFNLYGNYNQTGGTLTVTASNPQYINFINNSVLPATKNYTQSGSSTVTNTNLLIYTVSAGATITLLNNFPNVGSGRTFTNNGTLMCGSNVVSGAGTFTQATNPAILGIGSANGITTAGTGTGNIQTSGINYNSGSNYIYNGSVAQSTGNGLSGTINNLTINNTSGTGIVNLTSPVSVSSTLTLNQGILNLGSNNLTLNNTSVSAIAGNTNSATNMIEADGSGYLIKAYPAGASPSFIYPIGDNTSGANYSPVTLGFLSNAAAGTIGPA